MNALPSKSQAFLAGRSHRRKSNVAFPIPFQYVSVYFAAADDDHCVLRG
jgi:hypothetical protein